MYAMVWRIFLYWLYFCEDRFTCVLACAYRGSLCGGLFLLWDFVTNLFSWFRIFFSVA